LSNPFSGLSKFSNPFSRSKTGSPTLNTVPAEPFPAPSSNGNGTSPAGTPYKLTLPGPASNKPRPVNPFAEDDTPDDADPRVPDANELLKADFTPVAYDEEKQNPTWDSVRVGSNKTSTAASDGLWTPCNSPPNYKDFGRKDYSCKDLRIHTNQISQVQLDWPRGLLYSISSDCSLGVYSLKANKLQSKSKVTHMALSSLCQQEDLLCVGAWDNAVYVYDKPVDGGQPKLRQKLANAHSDNVSCLDSSAKLLVSGSWDGTVKSWAWRESELAKNPTLKYASPESSECKCISMHGNTFVVGFEDGSIGFF